MDPWLPWRTSATRPLSAKLPGRLHAPRARAVTFSGGCCARARGDKTRDMRLLPLSGVAPERAGGPERIGGVHPGGLGRFRRVALDVGVDLRRRGSQLGAGHGSLARLPPAESGQRVSGSRCPSGFQAATGGAGKKRRRRRRGSVSLPAAPESWGALRRGSARLLASIPGGNASFHASVKIHASSRANVSRSANPAGSPSGYITSTFAASSLCHGRTELKTGQEADTNTVASYRRETCQVIIIMSQSAKGEKPSKPLQSADTVTVLVWIQASISLINRRIKIITAQN